jgi:ABC-type transport system involved in multi-copper enzyme maturation permease subunit
MNAGDGFKSTRAGSLLPPPPQHARYGNAVRASLGHALIMLLRRQRVLLAAGVTLLPVLIPLALAFLSKSQFSDDGNVIFIRLSEDVFINVLAPLLALFFATMLIGEDAESQTLPYVLTRPIPRSAWVLGRYAAFVVVATTILGLSLFLTFAACTTLTGIDFTGQDLRFAGHYLAVATGGLFAYGALTMFLGTYFKKPIVIGVLFLYGWQYLANLVPGVVDFLTIQKYTDALLPKLAESRHNVEVQTALLTYNKEIFMVSATNAILTLAGVTVAFVALSVYTVRQREYAAARAAGG